MSRLISYARYENGPFLTVTLADVDDNGPWFWWAKAMRSLASWLYLLGVISGSRTGFYGNSRRDIAIHLTIHPRPYVLGRKREHWFHHVRFGHSYFDHNLGFCGKCCPWPCCGAVGYEHLSGCEEGS